MNDDMISVLAKQSDELIRQDAEIARLMAKVITLTAQVKTLRALLAEYEAEADAPTICEGATE